MSLLSEFSQAADIRRVIESKMRAYAPEWRFSENDPDGGTALALAFADMFGETAERLGRVPYKYFLYFLNMLETKIRSVSPATGLVSFKLLENAEKGRRIPAGTQLYADTETEKDGRKRIVFETENEITAAPSKLTAMYGVDPKDDVINALDPYGGELKLFYADKDKNLQAHRFSVWRNDALNIKSPARISLKLESGAARQRGERNSEKLSDPEFARWSFVRNGISEPVGKVYLKEGIITLELEGFRPEKSLDGLNGLDGRENNGHDSHLVCDMKFGREESGIMTDGIFVGSAYLESGSERGAEGISPDRIYYNNISLKSHNPGYLFGREPGRYDSLLISCDEVMSKRGARVNLTMVMHTVIKEVGSAPDGPVYNWDGRYVIEKSEGKTVTPDNIYISDIVWEYWNDVGWAHLETEGANNPFRSSEDIRRESVYFTCPEDMSESYQNSIWGFWIRARIISVENPYSAYGLWQLPFAESVSFDYDYGSNLRQAQTVKVENNAESVIISPDTGLNEHHSSAAAFSLYKPLLYPEHAVYLAFDKQPAGYPLSVFFGFDGPGERSRVLSFDRLCKDASGGAEFRMCKVIDGTGGLKDSGIVSVFVPSDMYKTRLFGFEAYWLRIADSDMRYRNDGGGASVLNRIEVNAVEISQKQTVLGERYGTELFESGKTINLPNKPVLSCEVFVDEASELKDLKQPGETGGKYKYNKNKDKDRDIKFEYDDDGGISGAWVKWEVLSDINDLKSAGPGERCAALDMRSGVLKFGNGANGRVPPPGNNNIRINYSYGGGSIGNLPVGGVLGLVSGIPTVASVTNFTVTGGGSDRENIRALERVGPARLRHRGRAVTLGDFENLILTRFPEITDVKAFAGLDMNGKAAQSFVTVAVLTKETENRDQVLKICRNAYRFLAECASCEIAETGRLAVVPALIMTVNAVIEAVADDITRTAETERMILEAVSERLGAGSSLSIGELPSASDIIACLRGIPNLTYVDRVLLEGQYFEGGKRMLTSLDNPAEFPFASMRSGTHIIRF